MSEDELKLNRRRFLRHSATITAAAGGIAGLTQRTDALAQEIPMPLAIRGDGVGHKDDYNYRDPP